MDETRKRGSVYSFGSCVFSVGTVFSFVVQLVRFAFWSVVVVV